MFSKRKTISEPEKSSLSYPNQGKTMILPGANNGMQLVYSIFLQFQSYCFILKSVSHTSKNSPELIIASIRL